MGQADAFEQIQDLVVGLRDQFGVDHVVYHWVSSNGGQYGFGTYDPVWAQRYVEQDYIRIDPVVIGCFQRFHPIDWRDLDWRSKPARNFQKDAIEHGIGTQGLSIPIRGPNGQFALLSVSHTCDDDAWTDFIEGNQRDLILVGHYMNRKALELEQKRAPEPFRQLSPREIDALTYLGVGHSRSKAAVLLSISEHTLRAYIESARFKLGAMNTTHAVARAATLGLIIVGGSAPEAKGDWPGRNGS